MATILLVSGPNLNLLGEREPAVYGTTTLDECVDDARTVAATRGHDLEHVQSNHEGDLVDAVQGARGRCPALIINAGALTHYSYALADALACYDGVSVELHLSNPSARDRWRHTVGARPGRHRHRGRLRAGRVPPRRRRRASASSTGAARRDRTRWRRWTSPPAPAGSAPGSRDADLHALLVTHLPNVRYLTGFTGSAGLLLVTADDLLLVTDGRYQTQAAEQLRAAGVDARVEIGATVGRPAPHPRRRAPRRVTRLGPRGPRGHLGRAAHPRPACSATSSSSPPSRYVEDLRRTKDPGEVARIRAACAIADAALAELLPTPRATIPPSGPSRSSSSTPCARGGASGDELRPDRGQRPQRRQAARPAQRPSHRRRRARRASTSAASSTGTAPT